RAISSILGCVAAVSATESPSQLNPALIHRMWTTGSSACSPDWALFSVFVAITSHPQGDIAVVSEEAPPIGAPRSAPRGRDRSWSGFPGSDAPKLKERRRDGRSCPPRPSPRLDRPRYPQCAGPGGWPQRTRG